MEPLARVEGNSRIERTGQGCRVGKECTVLHYKEGRGGGMAADRIGLCERGGGGVRKVGLLSPKRHPVDAPDTSRRRMEGVEQEGSMKSTKRTQKSIIWEERREREREEE